MADRHAGGAHGGLGAQLASVAKRQGGRGGRGGRREGVVAWQGDTSPFLPVGLWLITGFASVSTVFVEDDPHLSLDSRGVRLSVQPAILGNFAVVHAWPHVYRDGTGGLRSIGYEFVISPQLEWMWLSEGSTATFSADSPQWSVTWHGGVATRITDRLPSFG